MYELFIQLLRLLNNTMDMLSLFIVILYTIQWFLFSQSIIQKVIQNRMQLNSKMNIQIQNLKIKLNDMNHNDEHL